jgi:hypothetical protein
MTTSADGDPEYVEYGENEPGYHIIYLTPISVFILRLRLLSAQHWTSTKT